MTTPVVLSLGGMTCASCAMRIEKKLNKLPGVTATVNYATENATIDLPADLSISDAIAAVESAGYTARELTRENEEQEEAKDSAEVVLRNRLIISSILTIPVVLMAMVPALQFEYWQWLSLTLASPVVIWGALPFHRATWINLRHGSATMDTLISMGVVAAYAWSLYALFFGGAGETVCGGEGRGVDLAVAAGGRQVADRPFAGMDEDVAGGKTAARRLAEAEGERHALA